MKPHHRIHNGFEDGLQSTGLLVSWKKSELLMVNVETLLREQCNTAAVCGEPRADGTCEILLQALDKSGAKFADSKDLLVSFLDMIKEGNPHTASKQPEVIDLSADDTVTCIILDDTCEPSSSLKRKLSESDDIVIIDSFSKDQASSQVTEPVRSWSVVKEVNEQSSKRRRTCDKVDNKVDVTACQDDDVIVLDDSFSLPSKEFNSKSSKVSSHQSDVIVLCGDDRPNGDAALVNNELSNIDGVDICEEHLSTVTSVISEIVEESSPAPCDELKKTDHKKAKNSKFAYKRVPHLVSPQVHHQFEKAPGPSNIYNPNTNPAGIKSGLRPIIIDGNNVAVGHGNGRFSFKGIQICINYFEKRGHRQIKAFLPHYRKNYETYNIINQMEKQGTVVITPSRKIDGKVCASYDDRFIVQYAAEVEGIIVSTDNYRDLLDENPKWNDTIKKRLLMFTWVDDLLMFPQDPLGRNGPTLDAFLKF